MAKGDTCKLTNCTNKCKWGHVCEAHYSRMWRHGNYDYRPNTTFSKMGKPCLSPLGYMRININGKRVLEHRHIMELHLGRKLTKKERIHHKNGIKTDNRIKNLELLKNQSEHIKKHHQNLNSFRKKHPLLTDKQREEIFKIAKNHTRGLNLRPKKCAVSRCSNKSRALSMCPKHNLWYYQNR